MDIFCPTCGAQDFNRCSCVKLKFIEYTLDGLKVRSDLKYKSISVKMNVKDSCNKYVDDIVIDNLNRWIDIYNSFEKDIALMKHDGEVCYIDKEDIFYNTVIGNRYTKYEVFMRIVSNCPMGLEKWMGISTNYMQLKTIINQREKHKLKEDYGVLCDFIKSLPHADDLILGSR